MAVASGAATVAKHPGPAALALTATGVVFGDIGTSPLYAFRESMAHAGGHPVEAAVGTASLAIWTVTIVVTLKYLTVVMKADNHGEGGILAMLALLRSWATNNGTARFGSTTRRTFVFLALLAGTALLFGDGALTPAISVLSATEGVESVSPGDAHLAVPAAVVILVALFAVQSRGTHKIGRVFGPVMVVWFVVIAGLGVYQISQNPDVLRAFSPTVALTYLFDHGWAAIGLLSVIILTVSGAEALYADMGHFGIAPIRLSWFVLVMPCLMLCYLGQAALVMSDPALASNPFYGMAPNRAMTAVLVVIATLATVIASQALITGAFSLAQQAVQMRLIPRLRVRHTSAEHEGQIYIPFVNWALGAACVLLTFAFGSSSRLTSAYVFAVSGTMLTTTIGLFVVAKRLWKWPTWRLVGVIGAFFIVDVAFFISTSSKIFVGGWVPVAIGAVIMAVMIIWRMGQHLLHQTVRAGEPDWQQTLRTIDSPEISRSPGTGVFLNSHPEKVPQALLTVLALTRSAPSTIVVATVVTEPVPYLEEGADQVESTILQPGVWQVRVRTGYMETIDLPQVLSAEKNANAVPHDIGVVTYYASTTNFQDTPDSSGGLGRGPEAIYDALQRNAATPTDYYHLPPNRVVTIGTHMDL